MKHRTSYNFIYKPDNWRTAIARNHVSSGFRVGKYSRLAKMDIGIQMRCALSGSPVSHDRKRAYTVMANFLAVDGIGLPEGL